MGSHLLNDAFFGLASGGFRDTNAWLAFLTAYALPGFYAGDQFGTFNWWMRLLTGVLAARGLAFFSFPRQSNHACRSKALLLAEYVASQAWSLATNNKPVAVASSRFLSYVSRGGLPYVQAHFTPFRCRP